MIKIILFSPNGYVGNSIRTKLELDGNIQLYGITRESDLEQYRLDYDVLIYSASITSARHETIDKYVQDNVMTAVLMMKFCKKHHIKRIIYLSSAEIYGDLNIDMVTDQATMVNPNLYATTKYLAERIIIESNIPYYILRLPGIVGQVWGETFIYRLMDKIRKNETIELYNLDKKFNNIVEIDDLVQFVIVLCNDFNNGKSEIFLLGNSENVSLREVIAYIKKKYHSLSVIKSVEASNRKYFALDISKAVKYGYCSKEMKKIIDQLYQLQEKT